MRKILTTILMVVGLLLGGLVSSAPAQAVTEVAAPASAVEYTLQDVLPPSDIEPYVLVTVIFNAHYQGAPWNIYSYKTAGRYTQPYNTSWSGIWKVCPIGYSRLEWWSPTGGHGVKPYTDCIIFNTGQGGTWSIGTQP